MGITIDVDDDVIGTPGLVEVLAWLHHVDETFSTYRTDSPISRLGRGELRLDEVATRSVTCSSAARSSASPPAAPSTCFAVPAPNGTTLDPSGYVKGWAIDHAAAILEGHGLRHFAINAGGDVALRGAPLPEPAWRVGIRDPVDRSGVCAVLALRGPARSRRPGPTNEAPTSSIPAPGHPRPSWQVSRSLGPTSASPTPTRPPCTSSVSTASAGSRGNRVTTASWSPTTASCTPRTGCDTCSGHHARWATGTCSLRKASWSAMIPVKAGST